MEELLVEDMLKDRTDHWADCNENRVFEKERDKIAAVQVCRDSHNSDSNSGVSDSEEATESEEALGSGDESGIALLEAAVESVLLNCYSPGEIMDSDSDLRAEGDQPNWAMESIREADMVPIQCEPLAAIAPDQRFSGNNMSSGKEIVVFPEQGLIEADRKSFEVGEASSWIRKNFKKVCKILGMSSGGFKGDILELFIEIDRKRVDGNAPKG
ncbi:hypothetical protein F0562_024092 [Nyssa sinensis]|uniref:Uncharacterized protein n=1 Tax=Nyssa sinensis TaxID=561372 RepID=A0A5J5BL43_9ASTE|nr:hypothetical protein F0562_024092 [Nyssa sinensis]